MPDEWGTTQDGQTRPRVVKRGIDDDHDEIPDGEFTGSEEKQESPPVILCCVHAQVCLLKTHIIFNYCFFFVIIEVKLFATL